MSEREKIYIYCQFQLPSQKSEDVHSPQIKTNGERRASSCIMPTTNSHFFFCPTAQQPLNSLITSHLTANFIFSCIKFNNLYYFTQYNGSLKKIRCFIRRDSANSGIQKHCAALAPVFSGHSRKKLQQHICFVVL